MTTTNTTTEKDASMTDTSSSTTTTDTTITGPTDQAADTPPDAAGGPLDADQTEADQSDPESRPGRDAARYRRQLREVEADRDQLRGVVTAMQRAEAERIADAAHLKPAALWASGAQLEDLLAENGTVDAGKVATAIATAKDVLGIRLPAAPPAAGQGNVGQPVHSGADGKTFEDAFKPRR